MSKRTAKSKPPAPFEAIPLNAAPAPDWIKVGVLCFYEEQAYYISRVPSVGSLFVHITDTGFRPGQAITQKSQQFFVPWACITEAPRMKVALGQKPTMAQAKRVERLKDGKTDIGDPVAEALSKCTDLPTMYKLAARKLGVPVAELTDRYGHLNNGQQRMNLGNRLRNAWKKGQVEL